MTLILDTLLVLLVLTRLFLVILLVKMLKQFSVSQSINLSLQTILPVTIIQHGCIALQHLRETIHLVFNITTLPLLIPEIYTAMSSTIHAFTILSACLVTDKIFTLGFDWFAWSQRGDDLFYAIYDAPFAFYFTQNMALVVAIIVVLLCTGRFNTDKTRPEIKFVASEAGNFTYPRPNPLVIPEHADNLRQLLPNPDMPQWKHPLLSNTVNPPLGSVDSSISATNDGLSLEYVGSDASTYMSPVSHETRSSYDIIPPENEPPAYYSSDDENIAWFTPPLVLSPAVTESTEGSSCYFLARTSVFSSENSPIEPGQTSTNKKARTYPHIETRMDMSSNESDHPSNVNRSSIVQGLRLGRVRRNSI